MNETPALKGAVRQPFTLSELDPQENGEQRWSVGKNGPRAYLTCDRETAQMICRGLNVLEALGTPNPK